MTREPESHQEELDTTRKLTVLAMLVGVVVSQFIYNPSTTNAIFVVVLFAGIIFAWNAYARWRSRPST